MKKHFNTNRITIISFVLLLFFGIQFHLNQTASLNNKYERELKLQEAFRDSIRSYQLENGLILQEKKSLQGKLKKLESRQTDLTKEQQSLLTTVRRLQKEQKKQKLIFAAAQIRYKKLIDSMNTQMGVLQQQDSKNHQMIFTNANSDSHIEFEIEAEHLISNGNHPKLHIKSLDFPNTQTVTFNFDKNQRKDYPVSFSVINSNPHFKAQSIESYVIPNIEKKIVDPNASQKIKNWFKRNRNQLLVGALSFATGVAISNF